ncbi:MAG: DUF4391 domain-containing protein [Treponema sp.]|nr:DUF4391 domain-containing protein [Treponema sp.]
MLDFPESTIVTKRIPKQKFYDNISITPAMKRVFTENIQQIIWNNKIAASTLNLAPGKIVTEIEVFKVELNSKDLNQNVLLQIDREIPYHILFILCFENEVQAWIGYKEEAQGGNNEFKVSAYYHTDWIDEKDFKLEINGLDIDKVYENFIVQIAGNNLYKEADEDLQDAVERSETIKALEKSLETIEKKARLEVQPRRKFELVQQVNSIKKHIEELKKFKEQD